MSVVIMGGGLAGLTLAIQLRQKHHDLAVTVIERHKHPVPLAAHKVGESTVEVGAHYFETTLGLKQHLVEHQLKKFGFRFFFSDTKSNLEGVTELGASTVMPTGSYQIDRGIFENYLAQTAIALGVNFIDSAVIRKIDLAQPEFSQSLHRIEFTKENETHVMRGRWLVDATGRAGLLKRKLGLAQANEHHANAVWFRVSGKIDVNEWSQNSEWLARCSPPNRWLSTNHLVGDGYWVWLIPLASGSHSVGIVCDSNLHPLETMNTFDKAMAWLSVHQPRLHEQLDGMRHQLQDFAFFKKFSYGCKEVFSGEHRWALTGEAGVFLDPFYSPGSDFIAMSNTFITEMVSVDLKGRSAASYAQIYQRIYFTFYGNMLPIYQEQYRLFADPHILPIKLLWDYTFYWGIMALLFCQNRLTDIASISKLTPLFDRAGQLNQSIQPLLRAWGELNRDYIKNPAIMLDQYKLPWFIDLNKNLTPPLSTAAFIERMQYTCALLELLAGQILNEAEAHCAPIAQNSSYFKLKSEIKPPTEIFSGNANSRNLQDLQGVSLLFPQA